MLPQIRGGSNPRIQSLQFGGLNETEAIADNEFGDMENMSSDRFPYLSPRPPRRELQSGLGEIQAIISPRAEDGELKGFTGVAGNRFYYNGLVMNGALSGGEKCLADFNGTIVIFPDKKYFDYVEYHKTGDMTLKKMERSVSGRFTFYSSGNPETDAVVTNTITRDGGWEDFKVGDSLSIRGFDDDKYNTVLVDSKYNSAPEDKPCAVVINKIEGNTITVDVYSRDGKRMRHYNKMADGITITAWVPDMSYVCVHNNRLWGVSAGEHGEFIYASALGSAFSFNNFSGLASDSWFTQMGTGGRWTGIASFGGAVAAFKANYIHQVAGGHAGSFSVLRQINTGCISHRSIVELQGGLFFLGYRGIYRFTGGEPQFISYKLRGGFESGAAGTDGRKYYISAVRKGKTDLYVFDTLYGVWHREDAYKAVGFMRYNNGLYSAAEGRLIKHSEGDEVIKWSATSKRFTHDTFIQKGANQLYVRYEMGEGFFDIETAADGREFKLWRRVEGTNAFTVSRCDVRFEGADSYKLRLQGEGDVTVYGIETKLYAGGYNTRS